MGPPSRMDRRTLLAGLGAAGALGGVGLVAAQQRVPTRTPPGQPEAGAAPGLPAPGPTRWEPGWQAGFNHAHIHAPQAGYGSASSREALAGLAALGTTHVLLTPFGYQPELDAPAVRFGGAMDPTLTDEHLLAEAAQARALGLEVGLKPHIWSNAFWRGERSRQDIAMRSEADWEAWFGAVGDLAVHYARVAEAAGCALFCVGLEYLEASRQRPGSWAAVAGRVREVFSGRLTYAANWWSELEAFADWEAFDLIGVNAYYPLSEGADPGVDELVAGWQPHLEAIEAIARRHERPVILTEAGLRTVRGAAARPWDQGLSGEADPALQARAYEALLQAFSTRDWFRGVYWWKSFTRTRADARDDYSPVGKPAAEVLRRWWT